MAEDLNIAAQAGAPEPPSSETTGDHLGELSLEELADAVSQRIYRSEQSQADKAVAALRKELLPFLEEGRQTAALTRALAKGDVFTEEELNGMDSTRAEAARVKMLEAEVGQLRAERELLVKNGLNDQQVDSILTTACAEDLVDFALEQGFITEQNRDRAWTALVATGVLPKERIASKGDEYGTIRFKREGRAGIRKGADVKLHENEPPPVVPASRSAAPTQQDLPAYELIKRGMAARQSTRAVPR